MVEEALVIEAKVSESWDETPRLRRIRLSRGAAPVTHGRAGQYVHVRCGDKTGIFALASVPGDSHLELLVRHGGEVADIIRTLSVGASVEVSGPKGNGYPLDSAKGGDLLFVAVGSGIAPIRSAVLSVLARPDDFGRITLVYGEKRPVDLAYAKEMNAWAESGVVIRRVLSRAPDDWTGARGYVQEAVEGEALDPERTHAFMSGMSEMMLAVAEILIARGVPVERIHRNL